MATATFQRGCRKLTGLDRGLSVPTRAQPVSVRARSPGFFLDPSRTVDLPPRSANVLNHKHISLGFKLLEPFTWQASQVRTLCRPPHTPATSSALDRAPVVRACDRTDAPRAPARSVSALVETRRKDYPLAAGGPGESPGGSPTRDRSENPTHRCDTGVDGTHARPGFRGDRRRGRLQGPAVVRATPGPCAARPQPRMLRRLALIATLPATLQSLPSIERTL